MLRNTLAMSSLSPSVKSRKKGLMSCVLVCSDVRVVISMCQPIAARLVELCVDIKAVPEPLKHVVYQAWDAVKKAKAEHIAIYEVHYPAQKQRRTAVNTEL